MINEVVNFARGETFARRHFVGVTFSFNQLY